MGTAAQYCHERSPIISWVGGRRDAGKYKQAVLTDAGCFQSGYLLAGKSAALCMDPKLSLMKTSVGETEVRKYEEWGWA